jgi:hypothetical protein
VPYNVTVNQDNLPEGAEVSITGLGTFKNGETAEVSDEQVEFFRVMNGYPVDTVDEEGNTLVGNYVRKPGPTLDKAEFYGITIEKVSARKAKQDTDDGQMSIDDVPDENGEVK